jgi:hypothetical protein
VDFPRRHILPCLVCTVVLLAWGLAVNHGAREAHLDIPTQGRPAAALRCCAGKPHTIYATGCVRWRREMPRRKYCAPWWPPWLCHMPHGWSYLVLLCCVGEWEWSVAAAVAGWQFGGAAASMAVVAITTARAAALAALAAGCAIASACPGTGTTGTALRLTRVPYVPQ